MAKTLFRRSFILIATAACAAAVAFTGLALLIMDRIYVEANYRVLGETVRALVPSLPDSVLSPDEGGQLAAAAWAASSVGGSDLRLTLIRPDGVVIADTRANPAAMENHASRPEVRSALAGSLGTARRTSATIGLQLIYAAFPIVRNGATAAVLRLAIEVPSLGTRLSPELGNILLLVAVFLAAAAAAALAFSRWLSLPLQKLAAAAQGYASIEGARPADSADAPRAPSPSTPAGAAAAAAASTPRPALAGFRTLALHSRDLPDEYRVLATSLDAMAGELALRVDKARSQGRELQAILNAMAEAVMALDGQLRIRLANPAAARLFEPDRAGGTAAGLTGRDLLESTRSVELSDLVDDCLGSGEQRERELALYQGGERWYQALAAPLGAADETGTAGTAFDARGGTGRATGVVLVLNDITELRRLERVRRDFVANVSHELRTPVQLIKGFSETLRESDSPDQQKRFLEIIERNAGRMDSLIHDLLTLARLEQEGSDWLVFGDTIVGATLADAIAAIAPKAELKGIIVELSCPEALHALTNAGLLEQAMLNLIDNAVKYSPEGGRILVSARVEAGGDRDGPVPGDRPPRPSGQGQPSPAVGEGEVEPQLVLSVRDQGTGIPAKDLPRIFERFYRVDKARSRELGGTGLGLAIVRHVARAHGGTVSVESWEGEGSLFTMSIPLRPAPPDTADTAQHA